MITPEKYLKDNGIELNTTAIYTVIDGYVRQPDLCKLLQEYAEIKLKEYQKFQYSLNRILDSNKI